MTGDGTTPTSEAMREMADALEQSVLDSVTTSAGTFFVSDACAMLRAAADALSAQARRWSMTYGELPDSVRPLIVGHEWDNKNISEQRDWAVAELSKRISAQWGETRGERVIQEAIEAITDYYVHSELDRSVEGVDKTVRLLTSRVALRGLLHVSASPPLAPTTDTHETQETRQERDAPESGNPDDGLTDWQRDCLKWRGKVLTGARSHWCFEWDELPVDETCDEWPCGCVIGPDDSKSIGRPMELPAEPMELSKVAGSRESFPVGSISPAMESSDPAIPSSSPREPQTCRWCEGTRMEPDGTDNPTAPCSWCKGKTGQPREPHAALIAEAPVLSKYHGQRGFEVERFIADYEAWRAKCRPALKGE